MVIQTFLWKNHQNSSFWAKKSSTLFEIVPNPCPFPPCSHIQKETIKELGIPENQFHSFRLERWEWGMCGCEGFWVRGLVWCLWCTCEELELSFVTLPKASFDDFYLILKNHGLKTGATINTWLWVQQILHFFLFFF